MRSGWSNVRWRTGCLAVILGALIGCAETATTWKPARVSRVRVEAPPMLTARIPLGDPTSWALDHPLDPEKVQSFDLSNADERVAFESYCRRWSTDASQCPVDQMWFPVDDRIQRLSKAPATSQVTFWVEMWPGGNLGWQAGTVLASPHMDVRVRAHVRWDTGPDTYRSCNIHLHPHTGALLNERLPSGRLRQCGEVTVLRIADR